MKIFRNLLIILILFFVFCKLSAQVLTVQAKLSTSKILIGDQINLDLFLFKPTSSEVTFPILTDSIPNGIDIIESLKPDTISNDGKNLRIKQTIIISSFDSGNHVIKPIGFKINNSSGLDTIYTDSLMLTVNTIKVDTVKKVIYDIKSPFDEPFSISEIISYVLWGAGFLLLIVIIVYVVLKYLKKEPIIKLPEKPKDPPHIVALQNLDKLKEKKLWQNNETKKYYSELTEIIRLYIEERFNIPALEMTSFELVDALKSKQEVPEKLKSEIKEMFSIADFVKFAKAQPLPNDNDNCMKIAYSFVNSTIIDENNVQNMKNKKGGDNE